MRQLGVLEDMADCEEWIIKFLDYVGHETTLLINILRTRDFLEE